MKSPVFEPYFWGVVALTALLTEILAKLAPRLGWTDAPCAGDLARKPQGRPVPAVGGLAVLCGLALIPHLPSSDARVFVGSAAVPSVLLGASLFASWLAGAIDDRARGGLDALSKVGTQLLAMAPVSCWLVLDGHPLGALSWCLVGVAWLNVANTFDNADGALTAVVAVGFLVLQPWVAAPLLGFLGLNLDRGRPRNRASRAPTAYLGDSGSFVLGWLVLLFPAVWSVLWIPFLDLMRLTILRYREGRAPWLGDRRHLAHRLEARGLPPAAVALCLTIAVLPGPAAALAGAVEAGILVQTLAFALLLWWAPDRDDSSRNGSEALSALRDSGSREAVAACPDPARPE